MKLLFIMFFILFVNSTLAEIKILDSKPQSEHDANLPFKYAPTPEEQAAFLQELHSSGQLHSAFSVSPPNVLRPVSEFEMMYGVLVRYPLGIPLELIAEISKETKVVTVVSPSLLETAKQAYNNAGVIMDNCEFIVRATDSFWTRDYGPWYSFNTDGSLNVINFTYNRPRPNDNAFNVTYAGFAGLDIYDMGIVHCGGNYMNDGLSIAVSSHIAYTENQNNHTLVNQKMNEFLGVQRYHVVQDPNDTYINHVDCWGKYLTPDTVLIRSVNTDHPQYTALENTVKYFESHLSAWGRPYKVVRVHTPYDQPYTNSLILNDRVFVPITGSTVYDHAALEVYKNALPGYTIIGVRNNTGNPWESTDALHCRVKDLAERNVIYIDHIPLAYELDYNESVTIIANFFSFTGSVLDDENIKIYYKINRGSYISKTLHHDNIRGYEYSAQLERLVPGDTLSYYLSATDINGITGTHPFIGEPMAHRVIIYPDLEKPVITHTPITEFPNSLDKLIITAHVTDNIKLDKVFLEIYTNLDEAPFTVEMNYMGEDIYSVSLNTLTIQVSEPLTTINYRILAHDIANPVNTSSAPENGWYEIEKDGISESDDFIAQAPLNISIYPNPLHISANKAIHINVRSPVSQKLTAELFNIKGQKILTQQLPVGQNSENNFFINIEKNNLPNGIYLMRFSEGTYSEIKKILILK